MINIQQNKMADIRPHLSIVKINMNKLNSTIKKIKTFYLKGH